MGNVVHTIQPKRKIPLGWVAIAVILMFVGYVLGLNEAKDQELKAKKAQELKVSSYWLEAGDFIKDDVSSEVDYRFGGFQDMNTILVQEIHHNQEPAIVETYYQTSQDKVLNIPVKDGTLHVKDVDSGKNKLLLEVIKQK